VFLSMAKKLFAGNLSWDTTNESLSQFFAQAGTVASAQVITDRYTGRGKGFGFVEMSTDEEAEKAKAELNGQTLDGRPISINDARPQQPRENFRGGGGGGGFDRGRGGRDDRRGDRY
jgi:RNA recognition motif-containing protein